MTDENSIDEYYEKKNINEESDNDEENKVKESIVSSPNDHVELNFECDDDDEKINIVETKSNTEDLSKDSKTNNDSNSTKFLFEINDVQKLLEMFSKDSKTMNIVQSWMNEFYIWMYYKNTPSFSSKITRNGEVTVNIINTETNNSISSFRHRHQYYPKSEVNTSHYIKYPRSNDNHYNANRSYQNSDNHYREKYQKVVSVHNHIPFNDSNSSSNYQQSSSSSSSSITENQNYYYPTDRQYYQSRDYYQYQQPPPQPSMFPSSTSQNGNLNVPSSSSSTYSPYEYKDQSQPQSWKRKSMNDMNTRW